MVSCHVRQEGAGAHAETWIVPTCAPSSREAHVHMLVYISAHLDACAHMPRQLCTHMSMHTHQSPTAFPPAFSPSRGFSPATLTLLLSLLLEVGTSYYAVAVVKRGSHVTINTLRGVKSCHTGINRTVGWNVPVGYLVESGRLSVMGCDVLKGKGFGPGRGFPCRGTGSPSWPLP